MAASEIVCAICEEPLRRIPRGPRVGIYVHRGGGLVVQRCDECDWRGAPYPPATLCPSCGTKHRLVVDHLATSRVL